jgi:hypothetical protein
MSVKDLQKSICMKQISVIWSIRNLILDTWWPIVFPLPFFPFPYFQCINSLLNFLGSWICCPNSEYVWSIIREFTTNQQAFYWSRQDSEEKVFRNKTHTEEKLHVTRPMCCQKIGYMLTIARLVINKVPDSLLTKYKQWYWWIIYYPMDHWSSDDIGRLDYIACCRGCIATVKNILTPKNTPKPWRTNWSCYWWKALLKTGKISIHCLHCASVVISIVHHALPCLHRMNLCLSHLGTWKVCCKVRC